MEEFLDMLRNNLAVVYVFIFIPIALIPLKVQASDEFKVYRLQHFDLQGAHHGSRSHVVNAEARAYGSKSVLRKCVVLRWYDTTMAKLQELAQQAVAGVLILLPSNFESLSNEQKELLVALEQQLVALESLNVPVFATFANDQLNSLMKDLDSSVSAERGASAMEVLLNAMFGNGFQLVTATGTAKPLNNYKMFNIVGRLGPVEKIEDVETIAIVAHYDSFAAFPGLSYGADADATGVAALFEIMRIMSRLYNYSKTRLRKRFVFVLSAGGKFNYQGIRHMLDDPMDSPDNPFHNLQFAMCLDMLGKGDRLHFYVSKPPRSDTPMALMFEELRTVGETYNHPVVLTHKKINLGDEYFGWEHERFSMKKQLAFTLSHIANPKDPSRRSSLDTKESIHGDVLRKNVQVITEALLRYAYNVTHINELSLLVDALDVQTSHLMAWIELLSSQPRSMQLFSDGPKNPLLVSLSQSVEHFLKDVQLQPVSIDKKEPELTLYFGAIDEMHIYRVKSAIFDLLLAVMIAGYVGLVYLFVVNFFTFFSWMQVIGNHIKLKQV